MSDHPDPQVRKSLRWIESAKRHVERARENACLIRQDTLRDQLVMHCTLCLEEIEAAQREVS